MHATTIEVGERMTRVYLLGVLPSLAHFHLARTMNCGLYYTQGQVCDAAHIYPLYLRIPEPTFRRGSRLVLVLPYTVYSRG